MALTQLERDRERLIEENRRRMADALGPMDQYSLLLAQPKAPKPARRRPARKAVAPADKRRSDRVRQLPAPDYGDIDQADRTLALLRSESAKGRTPKRCAAAHTPRARNSAAVSGLRPDGAVGDASGGADYSGWSSDLGDCSPAAAEAAFDAACSLAADLVAKGRVATAKRMSYSQVASGFWMQLPRDLVIHFPHRERVDAELVSSDAPVMADGTTPPYWYDEAPSGRPGVWRVVFLPRDVHGESAGLSGGWGYFAKDQRLFPGDTVVFEKDSDLVLRAHVFRGADYETRDSAPQGMPARVPSLRGIRTTPALAAAAATALAAGAAAASPGGDAPSAAATPAPGAAGAAPLAPPQQQRAAGAARECADDPPSSSLPQGAASGGSGAPHGAGGAELATPEPATGAAAAAADAEASPPLAFSAGGFECDGQQGDAGMDCMDCMDCMDGLDCMDGTDCMDCNDGMDGMRADGVNGISSGGDDDGGVAADCDLAHPSGAAAAPSARAHIDQECSEGLAVALAAAVGSAAGGSAGRETRLTRDVQAGCKILCSSSGGRGRKRRAAEGAGVPGKGATDAAADAPRKTRDQADGAAAGGCRRSTKRQTRSRAAGASGGAGEVAAGGSTKAARGGGDEAERRATRDQPGFPGATPRQQAEADRAWAAGEEVAMRPQSVPKKTAEEHRREAHDKEFWVRCIKGHRLCRKTRKREFLVHWWYFSDAWNSWEPREMLSGPPGTYKWALPMPSAVARIK